MFLPFTMYVIKKFKITYGVCIVSIGQCCSRGQMLNCSKPWASAGVGNMVGSKQLFAEGKNVSLVEAHTSCDACKREGEGQLCQTSGEGMQYRLQGGRGS